MHTCASTLTAETLALAVVGLALATTTVFELEAFVVRFGFFDLGRQRDVSKVNYWHRRPCPRCRHAFVLRLASERRGGRLWRAGVLGVG